MALQKQGDQMNKKRNHNMDPAVKELDAIKRLLILMLIKAGTPQGELAKALNIDAGNFSRMYPTRGLKRFKADE
jgi:hypothetical protein